MNGVLVDTSVWVAHFRRPSAELIDLLKRDLVLTHPLILGELTCGTPPAPRAQTLKDMSVLQKPRQAALREVMYFIEREQLYGFGCGIVDMALLSSTLITPGVKLWAFDKRLAHLASRFRVQH
ncbi:hypothetical protein SAMN05216319_1262 [Duganella sp. CF402]|uniref:VapC toxin family PIN domain ribonuclease n=1 Tax=unclassified Duganella TaxID=2636909 RepID=UPI0008B18E2B|nr:MULTISPECIES: VapC toxin family PIN domain ribonuclease [unclassified Duganella]RZT10281.1 hypothetical protein EV582_2363 [Duganella sp. BK701]SEL20483.1 hypothetical protein SAMN05216319_1262 [Duganella sp. CF402]